jgi:hypothetical protein
MPLPSTPPPFPQPSLAFRAGSLLGAGTFAALASVFPSALRVASFVPSGLGPWLALAACATVPATIAVAVLRSAREGARAFAGDDASLAAWSVGAWALSTFLALTGLGAALRATTHHHGLAGVTFAFVGLGFASFLALIVRRVAAMARSADPFGRAALLGASIVALGAASLLVAVRAARAAGDLGLPLWAGDALVDALAFAIASGFLSRMSVTRTTWIARIGIPLALGVVGLGLALLSKDAPLVDAIRAHVPWVQLLLA